MYTYHIHYIYTPAVEDALAGVRRGPGQLQLLRVRARPGLQRDELGHRLLRVDRQRLHARLQELPLDLGVDAVGAHQHLVLRVGVEAQRDGAVRRLDVGLVALGRPHPGHILDLLLRGQNDNIL